MLEHWLAQRLHERRLHERLCVERDSGRNRGSRWIFVVGRLFELDLYVSFNNANSLGRADRERPPFGSNLNDTNVVLLFVVEDAKSLPLRQRRKLAQRLRQACSSGKM